jgi:hypothetical protein
MSADRNEVNHIIQLMDMGDEQGRGAGDNKISRFEFERFVDDIVKSRVRI